MRVEFLLNLKKNRELNSPSFVKSLIRIFDRDLLNIEVEKQ